MVGWCERVFDVPTPAKHGKRKSSSRICPWHMNNLLGYMIYNSIIYERLSVRVQRVPSRCFRTITVFRTDDHVPVFIRAELAGWPVPNASSRSTFVSAKPRHDPMTGGHMTPDESGVHMTHNPVNPMQVRCKYAVRPIVPDVELIGTGLRRERCRVREGGGAEEMELIQVGCLKPPRLVRPGE